MKQISIAWQTHVITDVANIQTRYAQHLLERVEVAPWRYRTDPENIRYFYHVFIINLESPKKGAYKW